MNDKIKVLDLFSGTGGFSYGLESTGKYQTVAFCENDQSARKVIKKHWPDVPLYDDVLTLPYDQLTGVDLICGGFPCQDISIANSKAGGIDGERSGLWNFFKKAIDEVRPKYAIVENVFAITARGLDRVLGDLASIGYDASWTIYDSQYFGVPQRRRRMYIVAVRDGIPAGSDIFEFDKRCGFDATRRLADFKESRRRDIQSGENFEAGIAYFTRQRSDEFIVAGVASTLLKRDYKDFTDLVVHQDGTVRRTVPRERLKLQGYPDDWFDGLELSKTDQYRLNGMTVNVVNYIGGRIYETFQI
jgi:DNA (cytosine-5)-methyltransferase 1